MVTESKRELLASVDQPLKDDILLLLQEAGKALAAKKPVVAHSCMRLAITELSATS